MKPLPLLHTVPIILIGVKREDSESNIANYTTIGDVAIAGLNPPLLTISVHENHYSTKCIKKYGVFSVNVPTIEMLEKVDFCGVNSGAKIDKSTLFQDRWSNQVPYIKDAPISLLCKVEESVQIEKRVIFIVRVTKTIKDSTIELDAIKSIQYGLDNNYYSTGEVIGEGYKEFKKIRFISPF